MVEEGKASGIVAAEKKERSPAQKAHAQRIAQLAKDRAAAERAGKAPSVPQDLSGRSVIGGEPPADPGDLYAAMYAVLQPGVKPRTPLQRACKEWLRDKPSNFAERYEALAPKSKVEGGQEKEKVLKDVATERCMEHLERLLSRHKEGL